MAKEKYFDTLDRTIWHAQNRSGYDKQTVAQWIATEKKLHQNPTPSQRRYDHQCYLNKRERIPAIRTKCRYIILLYAWELEDRGGE